jgi:L-threonylcarbamoyladenylate synthase
MDPQVLERAGALIRAGRLVAFPTETVYGLGANALDEKAVRRIYEVKQRPASSPMIVHVASIEMARSLAREWPESAEKLAQAFWPGPLTLVVPKQPSIPPVVTSGIDTVGLRMPSHPVALALIRAAGVPVAAPSANRFKGLSPTTAGHVRASLGGRVDMILDGGMTKVGIESTVLTLATATPRILRPGMISRKDIEAVIGPVEEGAATAKDLLSSPGMHSRHYSPRTRLFLVESSRLPARPRSVLVSDYAGRRELSQNAAGGLRIRRGSLRHAARTGPRGLGLDRRRAIADRGRVGRHPRPPPSRRRALIPGSIPSTLSSICEDFCTPHFSHSASAPRPEFMTTRLSSA